MTPGLRHMTADDIPALDTMLQAAYKSAASYERRLRDAHESWVSPTFVIDDDVHGPVGMVTLHDYVTSGYVALMGVHPDHQRVGYGRRLMYALIVESEERGHETLALEASDVGRPLYAALGFAELAATLTFEGPCASEPLPDTRIRRATAADVEIVCAYDAAAFGGDRSTTIRRWFNDETSTIFLADDGEYIGGYAVAREGRIAPWMAQSPGAAAALFDVARASLAKPFARIFVPEENLSALAILAQRGWKRTRRHAHMARGKADHVPRRAIYGLISLGEG